jgi:hypothetical protein
MAKPSNDVWLRVGIDPEARLRWLLLALATSTGIH